MICADLAALDQTLVYNRFGSFNPFGMIFALRRDLEPLRAGKATALTSDICDGKTFTDAPSGALSAGSVRLRDCKRPRPVTLRVNVGDTFVVRMTNYLTPPGSGETGVDDPVDGALAQPGQRNVVDFSKDFCKDIPGTADWNREAARPGVSKGDAVALAHHEVSCPDSMTEAEPGEAAAAGRAEDHSDWPNTRGVNLVVQGLTPIGDNGAAPHPACMGMGSVAPDDDFVCTYKITEEGTYFFASAAAPAGGEGDGGSIVHGLFGAVLAEREGSRVYRSQTSKAVFDAVWPSNGATALLHDRTALPDYEKTDSTSVPYLNMVMALDRPQADFGNARRVEIVHSDLNAIVWCDRSQKANGCVDKPADYSAAPESGSHATEGTAPEYDAFREFSVFFHDELKTFYTKNFEELQRFEQLAGVKDGFAINYGASGMGSILLANRKGIGPAADCMECLYEEFFLTSWANGDPALLEWYADDPSNVHHSYMNDPVVFRNFHAGPKETHVFHLHAHQWFAGNDPNRGAYLDSQTVGPQQGFSYNIYHGGLRGMNGGGDGWWDTQGSGNRNRTVGDSIFHCHLYPHFAQGMWALWRVHDVLEDGTRKLPDGQADPGLSLSFKPADAPKRLGSVNRVSGAFYPRGGAAGQGEGTPIPALIPLPGEPIPLIPTYSTADTTGMPGYPFYIPADPGHRPPQAPLDIARALDGTIENETDNRVAAKDDLGGPVWLDGGLSRHIVKDGTQRELGFALPAAVEALLEDPSTLSDDRRVLLMQQIVAKALALGDMSGHLKDARIERLSNEGTTLERAAMGFHYNGRTFDPANPDTGAEPLDLKDANGTTVTLMEPASGGTTPGLTGQYKTVNAPRPDGMASGRKPVFAVNGSAPKPGAPFADPCGAPRDLMAGLFPPSPGTPLSFDPLVKGMNDTVYGADPFLTGFRRYEVSAVQLDLIVNKAGWHDPQARINVLTADSDAYKTGSGGISPFVSDKEEPFFFRALSGECIEFRHTNELPKDLELDDFQVRTPTDTIGQHIHLVKFDVTSSDGSGNGWNYEDGTFAADELMARRCAANGADLDGGPLSENAEQPPLHCDGGEVAADWKAVWRKTVTEQRELFQTTTQRWFADPILSPDEQGVPQDRTLRTVFTHDHFGPSSIQQHGFYSALLVEPGVLAAKDGNPGALGQADVTICPPRGDDAAEGCSATLDPLDERLAKVAAGTSAWVGSTKRILTTAAEADPDPLHPNAREFALAVADFALLYDPRDRVSVSDLDQGIASGFAAGAGAGKGMAQLLCDLRHRGNPKALTGLCGGSFDSLAGASGTWHQAAADAWTPAWLAGARIGHKAHTTLAFGGLVTDADVAAMRDHLVAYREHAAGKADPQTPVSVATLATPVAAPTRPESISVDHHDPYLVNYRMAAIPVRIGDKASGLAAHSADCRLLAMRQPGAAGPDSEVVAALTGGDFGQCSLNHQLDGDAGDVALAFSSKIHGDPETPILEAYQGERIVFRMIQGAQEVQHSFQVAGQPFRRNIDQAFPTGALPLDRAFDGGIPTRMDCLARTGGGRPGEYLQWSDGGPEALTDPVAKAFWEQHEAALALCDNVEGFSFAQEIGISEHFEMKGSLRSDQGASREGGASPSGAQALDLGFFGFDSKTGRSLEANPDGMFPPDADLVPATSSDYLYSFGTVDALWNGAWGLVRVYKGTDSADPQTFNLGNLQDETGLRPISDRLGSQPMVPPAQRVEAANAAGEKVVTSNPQGVLTCRLPDAGNPVTVRRAVIAAVEARNVWGEALNDVADPASARYGDTRFDPDALVLALVDPALLGKDAATDAGWKGAVWEDLPAADVYDAVRAAYPDGPQPFVLRANAGDCIEARLINALEARNQRYLRDLLGDAVVPPIAGLNTDPAPVTPEFNEGLGRLEANLEPLKDQGPDSVGLRPSASLALMFGVPSTELIVDIPLGYGFGKRPMAAPDAGKARVSSVISFYAGRYRLNVGDEGEFLNEIATETAAGISAAFADPNSPVGKNARAPALTGGLAEVLGVLSEGPDLNDFLTIEKLAPDSQGDPGITGTMRVAGTKVGLSYVVPSDAGSAAVLARIGVSPGGAPILGGSPDLAAALKALCDGADLPSCHSAVDGWVAAVTVVAEAARDRVQSVHTHWIPYAFGAAPIRAISDPIGQEAHGLIGVVDVVPKGWSIASTEAGEPDMHGRQVLVATPAPEQSDGLWADFTIDGPDGETLQIREFVLFYRDGMNLWDNASRIRWTVGGAEVSAPFDVDGSPGADLAQPVPDCHVCDDSYDRGDKGVNYRSPALASLLSGIDDASLPGGGQFVEASDDFNVHVFPPAYADWPKGFDLRACKGQQVVIRIVHPGGRARQRTFVTNGYSYDDLFPSFGFPRGALLAPGKSVTAWLDPGMIEGSTAFWHDGPTSIMSGGVWGRVTVAEPGQAGCP